jgi:hypothetical protein
MVGGPLAEELFGDGSCRASDNIEELCGACILTMRAAELLGCAKGPLWMSTLNETAARVEFYGDCIHATDLAVKNVLECMDKRVHPSAFYELSLGCLAMIDDIKQTLVGFVV